MTNLPKSLQARMWRNGAFIGGLLLTLFLLWPEAPEPAETQRPVDDMVDETVGEQKRSANLLNLDYIGPSPANPDSAVIIINGEAPMQYAPGAILPGGAKLVRVESDYILVMQDGLETRHDLLVIDGVTDSP